MRVGCQGPGGVLPAHPGRDGARVHGRLPRRARRGLRGLRGAMLRAAHRSAARPFALTLRPVQNVAVHPLRRALPLFLLAGLCFSTLDATAKWLVRDHTLFVVVWARYVGQMLVTTPIAWHRVGPGFWRTRHLRIQLLRSLCLVVATMSFFSGLRFLPLAEASAITFLAPMFAIVLSMPVLGERPTRARWISAMVGFAGIVILVRPGSAVFHPATAFL